MIDYGVTLRTLVDELTTDTCLEKGVIFDVTNVRAEQETARLVDIYFHLEKDKLVLVFD